MQADSGSAHYAALRSLHWSTAPMAFKVCEQADEVGRCQARPRYLKRRAGNL